MIIVVAATTGVLILALAMAYDEINRARRLTIYTWTIAGIGLLYGPVSAFVYLKTASGANPYWAPHIPANGMSYLAHPLAAILLLLGMLVGRFLCGIFLPQTPRRSTTVDVNESRKLLIVFCGILVVAVAAQGVYTHAYGGYVAMLGYSRMIRSGLFEVHNPYSFLYPLSGFAAMAFFGFFGLMSERKDIRTIVLTGVAFACSLYVFYSWLGRISFSIFIMSIPLGCTYLRKWSPYVVIATGVVLAGLAIAMAYAVSNMLELKTAANFTDFLAKELSFPFASFFAQLRDGRHIYLMFKSILVMPIYFLPSSLIGGFITSESALNTQVLMGARKGTFGVTGEAPVDLLTFSVMQASFYGIAVTGALAGMFVHFIQYNIDLIHHRYVRAFMEAYVALKVGLFAVAYADPAQFIPGNFALIGMLAILRVIDVKKKIGTTD